MKSMVLLPTALRPSPTRKPYFDGWQTENAVYRCECNRCSAQVSIPFATVQEGAWGWRERFTAKDVETLEKFFSLPNRSLALSGGWPSISKVTCSSCGADHVFYADLDEYRNSTFRVVAQGLAEHAA